MIDYPDDTDGVVLKQLAESGLDMSSLIEFEFFVDAPSEASSVRIRNNLEASGFNSEIYFDEGELDSGEEPTEENREFWPSWTVSVFIKMQPILEKILQIQKELNEISIPFGGNSDGWQVGG